jgi:endonuclease/exonuclease/phosphatase family metal-dependent hydrolase
MLEAIAQKWSKIPMIIAGDFNITTAIRQSGEELENTAGEVKILHRMKNELGVFNAWQYLYPNDALPQTLRWSNKPELPYHCDGVFLSEGLLPHLASAEIVGSGAWASLSDHNPIVVFLD